MLLFDPVNHTDTGMYKCKAYNHPQCYNEDKVNLTVECEFSILYTVANSNLCILCTPLV